MPKKMMLLVKRKPGMSPEELRDGHESCLARLGVELFGHLRASHRRSCVVGGHSFAQRGQGSTDGPTRSASTPVSRSSSRMTTRSSKWKISAVSRDRSVADETRWFHPKRRWTVTVDLSPRGNATPPMP